MIRLPKLSDSQKAMLIALGVVVFVVVAGAVAIAVFSPENKSPTDPPGWGNGDRILDFTYKASLYLNEKQPIPIQPMSTRVHDVDIQQWSSAEISYVKVWLHFNDTDGTEHNALIIMEDKNTITFACMDENQFF